MEKLASLIQSRVVEGKGIKFSIEENGLEIARAYLYVLQNDLHSEPWGFLEDVFVHESYRGKGYGTAIVQKVIAAARENGCYKLICTSKLPETRAHNWYQKLGFKHIAIELRVDFPQET